MSESNIITGQYVRISQTPAGLGSRIVATIIDIFVIFFYLEGLSLLLGIIKIDTGLLGMFLLFYLPTIFYSFLFEVFNNGRSPGKMIMKTRVVKKDGSPPGLGEYFMRWLLQLVDIGFGFIGILVIVTTKNSQRLGDLAAGTMVIQVNNYRKIQVSLDEFTYLERNYRPVYAAAERLTLNQVDVIRRTVDSDYGDDRERRIETLSNKIHSMFDIPNDGIPHEKFLYTLMRDYQHYALELV